MHFDEARGFSLAGQSLAQRNPENKLFIGGLAWATNDEGLYRAFEHFRPTNARVVMEREDPSRSRGFGFVSFATREDADMACQKMTDANIDGRQIRCDHAGNK
jgi:RNA recognition motif-containing protein